MAKKYTAEERAAAVKLAHEIGNRQARHQHRHALQLAEQGQKARGTNASETLTGRDGA